jgi:hypothetical protein
MSAREYLSNNLKQGVFTRMVAFGSSNTERCRVGMHWFDCFELACRTTFGTHIACINSGRSGDTTRDLLERLDRDCLDYRPGLVFITIGGNDAKPERLISIAEYERNLRTLIGRLQAAGSEVVVQTYYAFDVAGISAEHAAAFFEFMEIARVVSRGTNCMLIDHLVRWEHVRTKAYSVFKGLMNDPMHVNPAGNLVIGLDVARAFSLVLPDDPYLREARATQALFDQLAD